MEEETSKNKCYLFPADPPTSLPLSCSDTHLLCLFVLSQCLLLTLPDSTCFKFYHFIEVFIIFIIIKKYIFISLHQVLVVA